MRDMLKISILLASIFTSAAFAVQPQAGMWVIDEEVNGQPGRGFQIDTQGKTLVFSYYGFREDGTANFHLASGPYTNDQFTGQLMEFKGGTPIGQAFRNGQELGSVGAVKLSFSDSTTGSIQLPGESPKTISRFTFSDIAAKFNGRKFEGKTVGLGPFNSDQTNYIFEMNNGQLRLQREAFFSKTCIFEGAYSQRGESISSSGTYKCADFTEGSYVAKDLTVDQYGLYRGMFARTPKGSSQVLIELHSGG